MTQSDAHDTNDDAQEITDVLLAALRGELHAAKEAWADEGEVYDRPDCPHCGEQMAVGAVGGGEITYGCYDNPDCDFRNDHPYGYSTTKRTGRATAARARYEGLRTLCHRIAREVHTNDG